MKKKVKKLIVPLIAALLALVSVILFFWDYSVPVMVGALLGPEDMITDADSDRIYIADTGNKRVIVTDMQGEVVTVIEEGLTQPTGLAVSGGNLFVCDKGNKLVYIYDAESYELVRTIDRPKNPLVGAKLR